MDLIQGGELFDEVVRRGHFSEKDAAIVIKQVLCDQIILDYLKNIYFFFLHIRGAVIVFLSIIITSDICITFFYIICLQ